MAKSLSTCLVLACTLALSGCVSPADELDTYIEGLPDPPPPPPPSEFNCADITGRFFFSINPKPLADGTLVHYQADVVYDEVGPTVDITLTPLTVDTKEPVAGVVPDEFLDLAVDCDNDASFVMELVDVVIPAEANPILLNTEVTVTATIIGHIVDTETWCGEIPSGMVHETGSQLDGSTIGALFVATPEWPDPPLFECPPAP